MKLKKFFLRIFKIKSEHKLISFPLDIKKFDKIIIICDESIDEIRNFIREINIENYLIIEEKKEKEEEFLNSVTKKSLIIDLRKEDKKIFFKYISKDFPVIGIRKDLKFVLPGSTVREFFNSLLKILL